MYYQKLKKNNKGYYKKRRIDKILTSTKNLYNKIEILFFLAVTSKT